MERIPLMYEYDVMSPSEDNTIAIASLEKIQREWFDLKLRVAQLETERTGLEAENKQLRLLLERVVEHRQKSHSELITLLTTLVSKLPINDIGVIVSRLMEHNQHVIEVSTSLTKGKLEDHILQPAILKQLDKTKRELMATLQPAVDELIKLDAPLEPEMLQTLVAQPENFYLPACVRASRGFVKGQLPRERVLREFGESALIFFKASLGRLRVLPSKYLPPRRRASCERVELSWRERCPSINVPRPASPTPTNRTSDTAEGSGLRPAGGTLSPSEMTNKVVDFRGQSFIISQVWLSDLSKSVLPGL